MTKARDIASAIPAPSTVSSAELGYLDGVTSAIQTQIDTKAPSSTAVTLTGTQTLTNKTLTNPVIASVINNTLTSTTGDMIYASGANTPARLGIGSSAQVLTVAAGIPSWATPAAGGGMTLISTTTLTGASVTMSSIPQTYNNLIVIIKNFIPSVDGRGIEMYFNGDTATNYTMRFISEATNFGMNRGSLSIGFYNDNAVGTGFGNFTLFDYANTTSIKISELYAVGDNATTGGNFNINMGLGIYNQTSAISSITLFPFTGNFTSGTALLYGVK